MPIVTIAVDGAMPDKSYRNKHVRMLPLDFYDRVNKFFDELNMETPTSHPKAINDWEEAAKQLDAFRSKISAYYGFKRDLIEPIYVADPNDIFKDCAFDVLRIGYEVKNAKLTCTGEVSSHDD